MAYFNTSLHLVLSNKVKGPQITGYFCFLGWGN